MASDTFRFKQFSVVQKDSAMKVGTDGVLLGAWATKEKDGCQIKKVVDVGCGTGVISLIVAQRWGNCAITGVEIDPDAAKEASYNFCQSNWSNRLNVSSISFQEFSCQEDNIGSFDVVISNPPYFINSLQNEDKKKIAARHAELLPYEDLVDSAQRVLTPNGELFVVLPSDHSALFIAIAAVKGLVLQRQIDVRGGYGKGVKRVLLRFCRHKAELTIGQLTIETETRGSYTEKYIELTSDLYLKM